MSKQIREISGDIAFPESQKGFRGRQLSRFPNPKECPHRISQNFPT
jgi:hypothetical protein